MYCVILSKLPVQTQVGIHYSQNKIHIYLFLWIIITKSDRKLLIISGWVIHTFEDIY